MLLKPTLGVSVCTVHMYRSLYLQVKTAVTGSDLVVVALGTGQDVEAEGRDRPDITLPGQQLQLLQDAVSMGKAVYPLQPQQFINFP